MKYVNIFLTVILLSSVVFANDEALMGTYPLRTGGEELNIPENIPANRFNNELDISGDTVIVGNSYYDMLQGGTVGRIISVTENDDHETTATIVWMRTAVEGSNAARHVKLNRVTWNNDGYVLQNETGGWTVDSQGKAGYPIIAHNLVADQLTPVFHSQQTDSDPWVNTYAEELSLIPGVFTNYSLSSDYPIANGCVWPKTAMGPDGTIHMIATEIRVGNTDEQTILYYRIPPENFGDPSGIVPQIITSHGMNLSGEIAVSEDGNTVVIGQTISRDYVIHGYGPDEATQGNNDIYLYISHDGGLNFDDPWNVTNFAEPDFSLLPDTTAANTDTMRAYTDMNILIDADDVIHLAFTAHTMKYITSGNRAQSYVMSTIYHWDDANEFWCRAADGNFFTANPGAWQSMVLHPSMYKDPETDILWMAFQQYSSPDDSLDFGSNGMPNGDIYITASSPNSEYSGLLWTTPINITETMITGSGTAGDCNSERDISLSLFNPGQYLHMAYMLDTHSGCVVMEDDGAEWSNCYIVYHRVSKEEIQESFDSWLPNIPMHVNGDGYYADEYDWDWDIGQNYDPFTRLVYINVDEEDSILPGKFELEQNYPNPFNPSTKIAFTINTPGSVKLAVYDIQGRQVASLLNQFMRSGHHELNFNGEEFASGIYFTRLEFNGQIQTRKMLLVK